MLLRFVRHGETDWNRRGMVQGSLDVPLNDAGTAQAIMAGFAVRGLFYAGFVSSPQRRALETAGHIARILRMAPPETDRRLSERSFGQAEGLPWSIARARFPNHSAPGTESDEHFALRTWRAVNSIARRFPPGANVLIVGHGFAIVSLLKRAGVIEPPAPGDIPNGSVTDFFVGAGVISVRSEGTPVGGD